MFKKKIVTLLCGAVMISGLVIGCDSSNSSESKTSKITISGSTSVGPTMEILAEDYQKANEGTTIEVQQVGSSAGITNTIDGTSQIGMSSRDLKGEEKDSVQGTTIAYDGVALLVNPSNLVKDITLEQIKKVYTGEITNWKELGGEDGPIVVVSREEGSGTRDSFQEIVGYKSEELVKNASISDGSGSVKTTVAGNKNAIGFASFEYIDDTVSALNVDGIEPTAKNVKEGNYKISRPFLLVTKKDTLTQNGQNLIDFILSSEGQQIVSDNKLITID